MKKQPFSKQPEAADPCAVLPPGMEAISQEAFGAISIEIGDLHHLDSAYPRDKMRVCVQFWGEKVGRTFSASNSCEELQKAYPNQRTYSVCSTMEFFYQYLSDMEDLTISITDNMKKILGTGSINIADYLKPSLGYNDFSPFDAFTSRVTIYSPKKESLKIGELNVSLESHFDPTKQQFTPLEDIPPVLASQNLNAAQFSSGVAPLGEMMEQIIEESTIRGDDGTLPYDRYNTRNIYSDSIDDQQQNASIGGKQSQQQEERVLPKSLLMKQAQLEQKSKQFLEKVPAGKLKNIGFELMEEIYTDDNENNNNNSNNNEEFQSQRNHNDFEFLPIVHPEKHGNSKQYINKANPPNFEGQESVIGKKTDTDFDSEPPHSFLDSFENEFIGATSGAAATRKLNQQQSSVIANSIFSNEAKPSTIKSVSQAHGMQKPATNSVALDIFSTPSEIPNRSNIQNSKQQQAQRSSIQAEEQNIRKSEVRAPTPLRSEKTGTNMTSNKQVLDNRKVQLEQEDDYDDDDIFNQKMIPKPNQSKILEQQYHKQQSQIQNTLTQPQNNDINNYQSKKQERIPKEEEEADDDIFSDLQMEPLSSLIDKKNRGPIVEERKYPKKDSVNNFLEGLFADTVEPSIKKVAALKPVPKTIEYAVRKGAPDVEEIIEVAPKVIQKPVDLNILPQNFEIIKSGDCIEFQILEFNCIHESLLTKFKQRNIFIATSVPAAFKVGSTNNPEISSHLEDSYKTFCREVNGDEFVFRQKLSLPISIDERSFPQIQQSSISMSLNSFILPQSNQKDDKRVMMEIASGDFKVSKLFEQKSLNGTFYVNLWTGLSVDSNDQAQQAPQQNQAVRLVKIDKKELEATSKKQLNLIGSVKVHAVLLVKRQSHLTDSFKHQTYSSIGVTQSQMTATLGNTGNSQLNNVSQQIRSSLFLNLQILLRLGKLRIFNLQQFGGSCNFFARYKVYGTMEQVTSDINWGHLEPDLSHRLTIPCSFESVQKMLRIPLLIEVWNKQEKGDDALVGLVRVNMASIPKSILLPDMSSVNPSWLHQSSTSQLLLIVANDNVPVSDLATQKEKGQLFLTIAVGSPTQISKFDSSITTSKASSNATHMHSTIQSAQASMISKGLDSTGRQAQAMSAMSNRTVETVKAFESIESRHFENDPNQHVVQQKVRGQNMDASIKGKESEFPEETWRQNESHAAEGNVLEIFVEVMQGLLVNAGKIQGELKNFILQHSKDEYLENKEFVTFISRLEIGISTPDLSSLIALLDPDRAGAFKKEYFFKSFSAFQKYEGVIRRRYQSLTSSLLSVIAASGMQISDIDKELSRQSEFGLMRKEKFISIMKRLNLRGENLSDLVEQLSEMLDVKCDGLLFVSILKDYLQSLDIYGEIRQLNLNYRWFSTAFLQELSSHSLFSSESATMSALSSSNSISIHDTLSLANQNYSFWECAILFAHAASLPTPPIAIPTQTLRQFLDRPDKLALSTYASSIQVSKLLATPQTQSHLQNSQQQQIQRNLEKSSLQQQQQQTQSKSTLFTTAKKSEAQKKQESEEIDLLFGILNPQQQQPPRHILQSSEQQQQFGNDDDFDFPLPSRQVPRPQAPPESLNSRTAQPPTNTTKVSMKSSNNNQSRKHLQSIEESTKTKRIYSFKVKIESISVTAKVQTPSKAQLFFKQGDSEKMIASSFIVPVQAAPFNIDVSYVGSKSYSLTSEDDNISNILLRESCGIEVSLNVSDLPQAFTYSIAPVVLLDIIESAKSSSQTMMMMSNNSKVVASAASTTGAPPMNLQVNQKVNLSNTSNQTGARVELKIEFESINVSVDGRTSAVDDEDDEDKLLERETTVQRMLPRQGFINISILVLLEQAVQIKELKGQFKAVLRCDLFGENSFLQELFPPIASKPIYNEIPENSTFEITACLPVSLTQEIVNYFQENSAIFELVLIPLTSENISIKDIRSHFVAASLSFPLIDLLLVSGISLNRIAFVQKQGEPNSIGEGFVRLSYTKEQENFDLTDVLSEVSQRKQQQLEEEEQILLEKQKKSGITEWTYYIFVEEIINALEESHWAMQVKEWSLQITNNNNIQRDNVIDMISISSLDFSDAYLHPIHKVLKFTTTNLNEANSIKRINIISTQSSRNSSLNSTDSLGYFAIDFARVHQELGLREALHCAKTSLFLVVKDSNSSATSTASLTRLRVKAKVLLTKQLRFEERQKEQQINDKNVELILKEILAKHNTRVSSLDDLRLSSQLNQQSFDSALKILAPTTDTFKHLFQREESEKQSKLSISVDAVSTLIYEIQTNDLNSIGFVSTNHLQSILLNQFDRRIVQDISSEFASPASFSENKFEGNQVVLREIQQSSHLKCDYIELLNKCGLLTSKGTNAFEYSLVFRVEKGKNLSSLSNGVSPNSIVKIPALNISTDCVNRDSNPEYENNEASQIIRKKDFVNLTRIPFLLLNKVYNAGLKVNYFSEQTLASGEIDLSSILSSRFSPNGTPIEKNVEVTLNASAGHQSNATLHFSIQVSRIPSSETRNNNTHNNSSQPNGTKLAQNNYSHSQSIQYNPVETPLNPSLNSRNSSNPSASQYQVRQDEDEEAQYSSFLQQTNLNNLNIRVHQMDEEQKEEETAGNHNDSQENEIDENWHEDDDVISNFHKTMMELRANEENEEHEEEEDDDYDGEDYQGQRMEGIHNHSSDSKDDMPIDYRATMKKSDIVGLANSGRNVTTSAPYSHQYQNSDDLLEQAMNGIDDLHREIGMSLEQENEYSTNQVKRHSSYHEELQQQYTNLDYSDEDNDNKQYVPLSKNTQYDRVDLPPYKANQDSILPRKVEEKQSEEIDYFRRIPQKERKSSEERISSEYYNQYAAYLNSKPQQSSTEIEKTYENRERPYEFNQTLQESNKNSYYSKFSVNPLQINQNRDLERKELDFEVREYETRNLLNEQQPQRNVVTSVKQVPATYHAVQSKKQPISRENSEDKREKKKQVEFEAFLLNHNSRSNDLKNESEDDESNDDDDLHRKSDEVNERIQRWKRDQQPPVSTYNSQISSTSSMNRSNKMSSIDRNPKNNIPEPHERSGSASKPPIVIKRGDSYSNHSHSRVPAQQQQNQQPLQRKNSSEIDRISRIMNTDFTQSKKYFDDSSSSSDDEEEE